MTDPKPLPEPARMGQWISHAPGKCRWECPHRVEDCVEAESFGVENAE